MPTVRCECKGGAGGGPKGPRLLFSWGLIFLIAAGVVGGTWLRYDVRVATEFLEGSCLVLSERQVMSYSSSTSSAAPAGAGHATGAVARMHPRGEEDGAPDAAPGHSRRLSLRSRSRSRGSRSSRSSGPTYRALIDVRLTVGPHDPSNKPGTTALATVCYPGCSASSSGSKTWWLQQYRINSTYACWYDPQSLSDVEMSNALSPWPFIVVVPLGLGAIVMCCWAARCACNAKGRGGGAMHGTGARANGGRGGVFERLADPADDQPHYEPAGGGGLPSVAAASPHQGLLSSPPPAYGGAAAAGAGAGTQSDTGNLKGAGAGAPSWQGSGYGGTAAPAAVPVAYGATAPVPAYSALPPASADADAGASGSAGYGGYAPPPAGGGIL